jgi:hypothetical protein
MFRRIFSVLPLLLCLAAVSGSVYAQTEKTITIRLLDSRTGHLIAASDYLVRINHEETVHANWVLQNEDGTGKLTVPQNATVLAAQARYSIGLDIYVNCDSAKDKDIPVAHWYAVSDILTSGVAAPNGCSKRTALAKPGEFVFFVRKQNWREQAQDFSSH